MADSDLPLAVDHELMAKRDLHFERTKAYFEEHEDFDEPSWAAAVRGLKKALSDAGLPRAHGL
jgi:hypothetical protein